MGEYYPRYVDWLNGLVDIDKITEWEDLEKLRDTAKDKIKTEGQKQLHDKIWGEGTIQDNKPKLYGKQQDLRTVWDRLHEHQETYEEIVETREDLPTVGLPQTPVTEETLPDVQSSIEDRTAIITNPTTPGAKTSLKRDPNYLTGISTEELIRLDDNALLGVRKIPLSVLRAVFPTHSKEEIKNLQQRIRN